MVVALVAPVVAAPLSSAPQRTPEPPPALLPPESVLVRYDETLSAMRPPPAISFEYTLDQVGERDLEQSHRIYRSGANERDETLSVDGERLAPPAVRIFRGRRDRYAIQTLAPRTDLYDFRYVGPHVVGRRVTYVFRTTLKAPSAFAVTQITIDGSRFLPLDVAFVTRQGNVRGNGSIAYAASGRYWVPVSATATAVDGGHTSREHIAFAAYAFPPGLPSSTFDEPRPVQPQPFEPFGPGLQ